MKMEKKKICPKCGKPYLKKCYLGYPGIGGIMAMAIHSTKIVHTPFGDSFKTNDKRCFLNQEQWDKLNPK